VLAVVVDLYSAASREVKPLRSIFIASCDFAWARRHLAGRLRIFQLALHMPVMLVLLCSLAGVVGFDAVRVSWPCGNLADSRAAVARPVQNYRAP
jgi:hypothetical protein